MFVILQRMAEHFPYQIVAFLDGEPEIGESAYNSPRGWFPQIALKRRFRLNNEPEQKIIESLQLFCAASQPLIIHVGNLVQPERMPVHILEVHRSDRVITFHHDLIRALGENLLSRYPERDGNNYLPHITVEYDGKFVVNSNKYENRDYTLSRVCLLKDTDGDDAVAYRYFELHG